MQCLPDPPLCSYACSRVNTIHQRIEAEFSHTNDATASDLVADKEQDSHHETSNSHILTTTSPMTIDTTRDSKVNKTKPKKTKSRDVKKQPQGDVLLQKSNKMRQLEAFKRETEAKSSEQKRQSRLEKEVQREVLINIKLN